MVLLWILHRGPVAPSTESVVPGGDVEFPSSAKMLLPTVYAVLWLHAAVLWLIISIMLGFQAVVPGFYRW